MCGRTRGPDEMRVGSPAQTRNSGFTGSSHCGVWGWSKRPGGRGQCRGTTTEHRSSPWAPHQPKLACNSGTRTFCSARKRCNSNGAISMFEIRVGELHATFLRNHNMRRHKGTTKCPKQETTQAQKTPTTPTAATTATTATSTGALHPIWGTAPDMGHCTRYGALHPLCGAAPEQKRCVAYGSGAVPQHTRTNAELTHRTTHRRTPPCAAGPYWWQDEHAAHATTCTPAHSDTSHTLTCEEPVSARTSRFACEQHTMSETVLPTTQTTSPTTPHCRRLSPRWSALRAPHHPEPRPHHPEPRPHHPEPRPHRPEPRPHRPEPRPHRHQTGGIAPIEARHAADTPKQGS